MTETKVPRTAELPETGGQFQFCSESKNRLLLSAVEAAALLGIGRTHFYGLHASGQVPLPVKLGRRTLWRKDELTAWVNAGCPARDKWLAQKGGQR